LLSAHRLLRIADSSLHKEYCNGFEIGWTSGGQGTLYTSHSKQLGVIPSKVRRRSFAV
jgi:hypothetical protein